MKVTKITRTYSKSINTKNYGKPESWLKLEASFEAEVESQDDPIAVSEDLAKAAKDEVVKSVDVIVNQMKSNSPSSPAQGPATQPSQEPRKL